MANLISDFIQGDAVIQRDAQGNIINTASSKTINVGLNTSSRGKTVTPTIIGSKTDTRKTITPKVFGSGEAPPITLGAPTDPTLIGATDKQTQAIQEQTKTQQEIADKQAGSQLLLASAKFGIDVINANSAYAGIQATAKLNILESRRLANDAIERGKQRALEAQVEGSQEGEKALLALAAQGQDVSGAAAQKVVSSLEDIGLYNGLQEETNAIREALGFDLEEAAIEFQLDQAEIQRDATILSSGLNLGATALGTL